MQLTAWLGLISLVLALTIGVVRKCNIGVVAVIFASVVGYFFCGMSMKEIYVDGWPTQVIFTSIGIFLLFGATIVNGTMDVLVDVLVFLSRGKDKLLPIIMFGGSFVICALGAGPPFCSALLPVAFAVSKDRKIDPLLMCLCTSFGIMAGGASPIAINGAAAISLGEAIGMGSYIPVWLCLVLSCILYATVAYFVLKGHKIPSCPNNSDGGKIMRLDGKQTITLVVIGVVILSVMIFKADIGLMTFTGGALLLVLKCADEKRVIKWIPVEIILLIGGCSILVNVVGRSGGIALAVEGLSKAMTEKNATGMMIILGGFLSSMSSAVGVVMPTLFPVAGDIAVSCGIPVEQLVAGITVGSNLLLISPTATIGGTALASIPSDMNIDKNKFFMQLFVVAVAVMVVTSVLGLLGVYSFILP